MLQSIKRLYGNKLGALDGEIGHVKDFYFDDQNWAVRYVVVDAGSWLTGRQVLISPHAFGGFHHAGSFLCVNLTCKQIENSPSIESHKPVSRQYEEEYYQYYGWPNYWEGNGLWGWSGIPLMEPPIISLPIDPIKESRKHHKRADAHLRCTQAVTGYHIQASDGPIGKVCDFMMDDQRWVIRQLVANIGHLLEREVVQIPMEKVDRISYEESTVFVNLTKEAIEQNPEHHLVLDGTVD